MAEDVVDHGELIVPQVFFDALKEDEGYAKPIESEAWLMLSSHGVKWQSP